jgi:hypothetical protein
MEVNDSMSLADIARNAFAAGFEAGSGLDNIDEQRRRFALSFAANLWTANQKLDIIAEAVRIEGYLRDNIVPGKAALTVIGV